MAGGWARDGAVHEQIEASIDDELKRMRSMRAPVGESWTHCAECEEPIPEARRRAVPGVKLCIDCQQARDANGKAAIRARRSISATLVGSSADVRTFEDAARPLLLTQSGQGPLGSVSGQRFVWGHEDRSDVEKND